MTNLDAANKALQGVPAAAFNTIGDSVEGVLIDVDVVDQTDFVTKEPKIGKNGKPIQQLVLTLRKPDDDEIRWFLKISAKIALQEALKTAGVEGLELGAYIKGTYSADEAQKQSGLNARKLFTVEYTPPTADAIESVI